MAWKKVIKRTRPSVEVDWEFFSVDVKDYIKTNYVDTGKKTSSSMSSSEDGLVLTYTSVFSSEAAANEFHNDSTILAERSRRNKVNADNDITKEVIVDEEV